MNAQKIFFSYSRDDSEFVLKLARDLRTAGVDVWLDQLDIPAGSQWDTSIQKALQGAETMLVVLSPSSVSSTNVMDEVSYALDEGKRVVPVLLKNCEVPFRVRRLQHIDFTGEYKTGLSRLLAALDQEAMQGSQEKRKIENVANKSIPTNALLKRLAAGKWIAAGLVLGALIVGSFKFMKSSDSETLQSSRKDEAISQTDEPNEQATQEKTTQSNTEPIKQPEENPAQESNIEPQPVSSTPVSSSENAPPIRGRINLLAPENGGHIVVASSDAWTESIDGKEDWESMGGEAVYAFKDERLATFDTFTMLIPDNKDQNVKEFELLVANGDPTGVFQSIGKFQTKNMKLFKTPYQEFTFRRRDSEIG